MILIVFIELIVSIVAACCFFLGVWVPSQTFLSFMFVAWVFSCIGGLIREARN